MNITELSWQARAEKLEAELSKAAALINAARDEAAISSVTCGQMRKELERVKAREAEMREAIQANHKWHEEYDDYGGYPDSELCEKNCHCLSISAGQGYVRADEMIPALERALVICQCFADGQEASSGFMDNNENVLRIKDVLAKAKGLPA